MISWHIWTINSNRRAKVVEYLTSISEVKEWLYPVVDKEVVSKKGNKSIKTVSLYGNYMFIKYEHSSVIQASIELCMWIKQYVGRCSTDEIIKVKKLNGSLYEDLMEEAAVGVGSEITLKFNGIAGVIVDIKGDKVTLSVNLFGAPRTMVCSFDDIVIND